MSLYYLLVVAAVLETFAMMPQQAGAGAGCTRLRAMTVVEQTGESGNPRAPATFGRPVTALLSSIPAHCRNAPGESASRRASATSLSAISYTWPLSHLRTK